MPERKSISRPKTSVDLTLTERWIIKMALEDTLLKFRPTSSTHTDIEALLEKLGGVIDE